jgi:hypothetical protein
MTNYALANGLCLSGIVGLIGGWYLNGWVWKHYYAMGYRISEIVERTFLPEMIINLSMVALGLGLVIYGADRRDGSNITGLLMLLLGFCAIFISLASIAKLIS